jgi:hypothetical protein
LITKDKQQNNVILCDLCPMDLVLGSKEYDLAELERVHLIRVHDGEEVWPDHPASKDKRRRQRREEHTGRIGKWLQQVDDLIDTALGRGGNK